MSWIIWIFQFFWILQNTENPENLDNLILSDHKQSIRIIKSFSVDYADLPYHLITSSPPSYGLPANTFSYLLKKSAEILFQYPLSLKINTPFLITQHGGSDACGGMAEKFPPFPPLSPHVIFISHEFLRFSVFSRIVQCEEELAIAKEGVSVLTHPLVLCS